MRLAENFSRLQWPASSKGHRTNVTLGARTLYIPLYWVHLRIGAALETYERKRKRNLSSAVEEGQRNDDDIII